MNSRNTFWLKRNPCFEQALLPQVRYLYVNRANDTAVRAYRHVGFVVRSELIVDIGNGYVMDDFLMAKSVVDVQPAPDASRR